MFSLKSRRGQSSKTILNENVSGELGRPQSKAEKDDGWCANLTTARNGLMEGMGGGGGRKVTSASLVQKVHCSRPDLRKMQCSS